MPVASDLRQEPGADTEGAAKQKAARRDLRGGREVTPAPTATRIAAAPLIAVRFSKKLPYAHKAGSSKIIPDTRSFIESNLDFSVLLPVTVKGRAGHNLGMMYRDDFP